MSPAQPAAEMVCLTSFRSSSAEIGNSLRGALLPSGLQESDFQQCESALDPLDP
jgi:hypothetical protein